MKKLFSIILFFICLKVSAQYPIQQRIGSDSTLLRSYGATQSRFVNINYSDTTAANLDQIRTYAGAMIYTITGNALWVRNSTANAWVSVGGGTVTGATNGLTLSGSNILLGGSSLSQYTPITTGSYPLTIISNGVNAATQTDSNSIRLINNTAAATSTDSNTTPALLWHVNGRKTLGGAASWPVDFSLDAVGLSGGSTTSALLRLRSKINNGTYATIFSINSAGTITSPLKIGSSRLGELAGTSVFFGNNAMATDAGADIIAIGSSSNAATTTGQRNIGIGTNTLSANNIGEENVGIGYNSLAANDTNYNTAVGAWSLYSISIGDQNAAFGKNAGWLTTTGSKNAFIGAAAGENNTTGSFNSWTGMDAGLQNTTGNENSAQGWLGGSQNRTGSYNSWFGSSSGRGISNGNYNVGIGRDVHYLGYAAGEYAQNDTVDNSIAIGAGVNTNKSNQMILGNVGITETKIRGAIYATDTTGITLFGQRSSDSALVRLPSGLWGGGGGSTPTFQQTLTAGSALTVGVNNVTGASSGLYFTNKSFVINAADSVFLANQACPDCYIRITATGETKLSAANTITIDAQDVLLPSIPTGVIDTTNYKPQGRHVTTGQEVAMNSWAQVSGGGSSALSSITAAAATNSINNSSYRQNWRWESLAGDTALVINATTTAAASDAQVGFASLLKGANSTSGQFTSAIVASNTHTGSTSENVGLFASASGGTYNYDAWFANANVSFGGASIAAGATDATGAVQGAFFRMTDNTAGGLTFFNNANYSTKLSYHANGMNSNQPIQFTSTSSGFRFNSSTGGSFFGGTSTASARVHIAAGTATAGTAAAKFDEGVKTTVAVDGQLEKDDAFYMTKTNAVRYGVGGSLGTVYTTVGNVGTGEDNLQTFSIPAGTLSQDGDYIEFTMSFSVAVNSTLKVYFGATQLFSYAALATDAVYRVTGQVVRTGATSQRATFVMTAGGATVVTGYQTPAETLSGAITLKGTGEGASNNDITQTLTMVKFFPAN